MKSYSCPSSSGRRQPACTYRRSVRYRRRGRILGALISCIIAFLSSFASGDSAYLSLKESSSNHPPSPTHPSQDSASSWNPGPDWKLTWSDDFTGPDSLNEWNVRTSSGQGSGRGHKELEEYSPGNVAVEPGGGLIITASRDEHGSQCWYGTCAYSSGRLDTKGLFQQEYGIFAARIKLPAGHGLWPAFWMESANTTLYGEIDVIESSNKKPYLVSGFAHSSGINHTAYLQLPAPLSAGYHIYGIEWTRNTLSWLVDGHTYGRIGIPKGAPFDQPFYLILNLAVGGNWPGSPDAATVFPAHMYVSWIHVYSQSNGGAAGRGGGAQLPVPPGRPGPAWRSPAH